VAYLAGRFDARARSLAPLNQSVVVAPFRVLGADASLEYLREGLVELLSTRLADDSAARSVDAGAVIRAWRRAGITADTDAPRDTVVSLAARLGAERVIVGSVVGTPERAIVRAAIVGAPSGNVSGEVTVEGPTDSLTALVDELAGKLLVSQAAQDDRPGPRVAPTLPALRAYLAGFAPYADGDYAVAADRFAQALRLDTTFALAALRLALAAERLNDFELQRRALDQAWRLREGLSERDRVHLFALIGPQYPAAAHRSDALGAWEEATRQAANRAEVWYGFAAAIAQNNKAALQGNDLDKFTAALARALELDPNYVLARVLLERVTKTQRIAPAPSATEAAADSTGHIPNAGPAATPFQRWRAALARADTLWLERLADSLPQFGPANLRAIALASQFEGARLVDGARALRALISRAANSEQAQDLLLAEHSLAFNQGRLAAALEATRKLQRVSPATRAHLRLRVLDAVFGEGDRAAAAQAAAELERTLLNPTLTSTGSDACALAHWNLARGDTTRARINLQRLRATTAYEPLAVSVPPAICAEIIQAALAVASNSSSALALVDRADSLLLSVASVGDAATHAHITLARLYHLLDQPEPALAALRRRPFMTAAWPRYLATAWREEGELAQQIGDVEGALNAYRRYLALRSAPDARLALEQQSVWQAMAELQAGGR
jgi:TolB-like protein